MIRLDLGDLQLCVLSAGQVWLDGGAMFGVVPKPLWEKQRTPDEKNRICLAMNLLLIDDGKRRTLVDTGAGDKWDAKSRSIYRLEPVRAERVLEPAGLRPDQIDVVISTHLHFDHAGGNTVRDAAGRLEPAFPNAEYVFQKRELETARLDNERIRASYLPRDFEPLVEQGRVRLVEGEVDVDRHIRLRPAPGHTPGMQIVQVSTPPGTVAFLADLCPTTSHVHYPYIMGYDLEPLVTLATKKRILAEAVREGWQVVFEHDAEVPLATIEESEGGRLAARRVEVEA